MTKRDGDPLTESHAKDQVECGVLRSRNHWLKLRYSRVSVTTPIYKDAIRTAPKQIAFPSSSAPS